MCLWLITACLGLLPPNPNPTVVIVQGVPTPILQPTTTPATTTTTTTTTAGTTTMTPATTTTTAATTTTTAAPTTTTTATTTTTTPPPTSAPTTTPPPTPAPTTAPPSTLAPTTAAPPTTAPATTTTTTTTTTARPTIGNLITSPAPIVTNTVPSQMTIIIDSREELLPVVLCNNPDVLCISNPDDNASGPIQIDPRVGTTPAASAALQQPPISGYSAQVPSYDTAVRFPREKRSILRKRKNNKRVTLRDIMKGIQTMTDDNHDIEKRQSCRCVPAGTCVRTTTNSGAGMIDVRIVSPGTQCPSGQEYCCGSTIITCGTLQTVPATAVAPAAGQANFGEYPWQALILTKQNDYLAGGVLIDQLNVLTVTHRLTSYIVSGTAPNVKVRLGEWDAAGTYEPVPFQEFTVQKVFSHSSYNANTLQYDITVLRLSTPVPISPMNGSVPTINRACLPPSSSTTYTGQRCWVSGWGKDMFGLQGQYQQILKEVDVPIVAPATCQTQMQAARLGSSFALDTTSFICAGGEANKDSCTGDGGSGLVCPVNGQWVVVGLVAWGLGCANANVPAAYVNIAALLPWIQQQVATA